MEVCDGAGKSPFYPTQPVPVELFVGRLAQINRILERGVKQVANGKPVAVYVQGEYGIGKSSIAKVLQYVAEKEFDLHGIYALVGGAKTLDDVARVVLEGTLRTEAYKPNRTEVVRQWLSKYIGKQELFGLSLDMTALRLDAPQLTTPFSMLQFFKPDI